METIKLEVKISEKLSGLLTMVDITPEDLFNKIETDLSNILTKEDTQSHYLYHYIAHLICFSEGFDGWSARGLLGEIKRQVDTIQLEPMELTGIPEIDIKRIKCDCCGQTKH